MAKGTVTVNQKSNGVVTVTKTKTVSSVDEPGSDVVKIQDNRGGVTAAQIVPLVSYKHNQNSSSTNWFITHNLRFLPNVTVFDSAGNTVEGNVVHTSINALYIEFSSTVSGQAVLS
jgi:hypothetical protein